MVVSLICGCATTATSSISLSGVRTRTRDAHQVKKGSGGATNVPNPMAEMEFTEYALSSRCVAWRCSKQTLARETALARLVPGIERVLARFCRLIFSSGGLVWLCAPQEPAAICDRPRPERAQPAVARWGVLVAACGAREEGAGSC